ncbi:tetratricopeptide repeat protein [Erythrobacter donghaensis]|uniref:tetratricopeptide repeat protein n=1 Tax=Erythrobacter donghaensis TaxID=267135 RepID=UPI000A365AB7|nr:tetratricopeptide repeat protein [Erythrobacter donghaensis]
MAVAAAVALPAGAQVSTSEREAAQAAYLAGNFARAEQLLGELLAKSPLDPDLLRRLAAVQAARGNLDMAQATIDRAYDLAPTDTDIQLARANILFWRGQIAEAGLQADQIAQRNPDYPGLDSLRTSLREAVDARKFRFRSAGAGVSVSDARFASGADQTWYVQRGSLSAEWGDGRSASLNVEREERRVTDTHIAGRVDLAEGNNRFFVAGTITPNPDFRETWSFGGGAEIALGQRSTVLIDGRFAEYTGDDVTAFGVGLRQTLSSRLQVSARSIHLLGGGDDYRFGAALRADYSHPQIGDIFAILASYPDVENDGAQQLRSVAIGVRRPLSDRLSLGVTGEYETRANSYDRTGISLDLRLRIGKRS